MPPRIIAITALAVCLIARLAFANPWPPAGLAGNDHLYVVPIEVESVNSDPLQIHFRIWKTDYALDVYRKSPGALLWGSKVTTIPAGTEIWTHEDNDGPHAIQKGLAYEYLFHAQGVPVVSGGSGNHGNVRTYVLAGVEVDRTGPRGRVVLVMPSSIQAPLQYEINRFKNDLVGDGWLVHDVLTPDGRTDWTCAQDLHHVAIREAIRDIYHAHPGEVKQVILLGRVPQPRSGLRAAWAPDGHGDLGAVAADCYYADVDNIWTDTGTISVGYGNSAGSVRPHWFNNPGDGRYDQSHFRHLPEAFEMGWGRIDFRGAINGGDEMGALRNYLNKLHDYKHAQHGFKPGTRSLVRDAGSLYKHMQEEFWKTITPLSGMQNLDYITGSDLPNVAWQPEAQYTYDHGPYLYFFMAGNEPRLPSDMGRAVFWTGFKSHLGYWDQTTWTRARLAEPNSWALSWTFSAPRGRYVYHKMALGGTMGDVMKASINNQDNETGLYGSAVFNFINGAWTVQNPVSGPGDYSGFTFMGQMGDPTLRDRMVESPAWIQGRLLADGTQVQVEWLASPEASAGYHIYASSASGEGFLRLTEEPLYPGVLSGELSWIDAEPMADPLVYMVRAIRLETTPGGTYWNASVGRMVEVDRSPAVFAITDDELATAYLGSRYDFALSTTGGNPPARWSLVEGTLPAGLELEPNGLVRGRPLNAGNFVFTLEAIDLQGVTLSREYTLTVNMFTDWHDAPNGRLESPLVYGGLANWSLPGWNASGSANTIWYYEAENQWAEARTDGPNGNQQGGIGQVLTDGYSARGAIAFRFDLKNTDGTGIPNSLQLAVYGVHGPFNWNLWDYSSHPSGGATLLHLDLMAGDHDWKTLTTPALPVGEGYQYYAFRLFSSNVVAAEGDFMAIDNLQWAVAVEPPIFYQVDFSAGRNGSLAGVLSQNVVGGGSTLSVEAIPAPGFEFSGWTLAGEPFSGANPLVVSEVSQDLNLNAHFSPFNHPPVSTINAPLAGAHVLAGTPVLLGGTGWDVEDGIITPAVWTSSLEGIITPQAGAHAFHVPGEHILARTITDSGGKTGSESVVLTVLPAAMFDQNFNQSTNLSDYIGASTNLFDYIGTSTDATKNRATLSMTDGGLRNTIAYTDDGNTTQLSASRFTRRTDLPFEDNFGVVYVSVRLAPDSWPGSDTTYFALTTGQSFRTGIFNPAAGTGNGPAFAALNLQARSAPNTFRTTGAGGNSSNFTILPDSGVYYATIVFAANAGAMERTFPSPTGDHSLLPGRVSVWINGNLHINNTTTGVNAAELRNVSVAFGSGNESSFAAASVFNGYYSLDSLRVKTTSDYLQNLTPLPGLYDSWALRHQLAPGSSAPGVDSTGHGIPNLLRYALGGTPEVHPRHLLPVQEISDTRMTLRFHRIEDPALTYDVWASSNLKDWGSQPIWTSTGIENHASEITVTDTASLTEHSQRFLRLEITRSEP